MCRVQTYHPCEHYPFAKREMLLRDTWGITTFSSWRKKEKNSALRSSLAPEGTRSGSGDHWEHLT